MLREKPGSAFLGQEAVDAIQDIAGYLEQLPSGSAKACIWAMEDGEVRAIFALDHSKEIAEHLKEWSEGKPEDWFSLHLLEKGPSYAGALMPNFKRTSDRWKINFQLKYGYPPPSGSESVMFRPIHFVAKTKMAFDRAKKDLKSVVRVGLVEAATVTPENFTHIKDKNISWLGSFHVILETKKVGLFHGWLNDAIDEMNKED